MSLISNFKFNKIHLTQIIFEFLVVYGQYIIDVPVREIEARCLLCLYRWEQRRWIPLCMNKEKMLARRGAQRVPIGMPTVRWKIFPAKTTKILSTTNSSNLLMSSSEYLCLESESSFRKKLLPCALNIKYLYLRLPFFKMKAFRVILVSVFCNFWWGMVV